MNRLSLRADVADIFDVQLVDKGGRPTTFLCFEAVAAMRDQNVVAKSLLALPLIPFTPEQVASVLGTEAVSPPGEDDEISKVAAYWAGSPMAPRWARERLTAAVENGEMSDATVISLVDTIEITPRVLTRIRRYAASLATNPAAKEQARHIDHWLIDNDPLRREDLIKELEAIPAEYVFRSSYRLDRALRTDDALRPMLIEWLERLSLHHRAIALILLYRQARGAEAADYRQQLQQIVENRTAPGMVRFEAMRALMMEAGERYYFAQPPAWEGRDSWFLSLLADPQLRETRDDSSLLRTIDHVVGGDPERFVPLLMPLLMHADEQVRRTAAGALGALLDRHEPHFLGQAVRPPVSDPLRQQIIMALFPLVNEPSAVGEEWQWRSRVIEDAGKLGIRAAVPHITAALQWKETRDVAAAALLRLTGSFGEGLRKELKKRINETERLWLYDRVWDLAPLSVAEIATAIEAWARHLATPVARPFSYAENLPLEPSIGRYASTRIKDQPEVARNLIRRIEQLPASDRIVADNLALMLDTSPLPDVTAFYYRRIAKGDAAAELIARTLARTSAAEATEQLRTMSASSDAGRAIAAVISRDAGVAAEILESGSREAFDFLLASARLTRWEVPIPALRRRLGRDATAGETAVSYLAALDTPRAREILWARYPRAAAISGEQFTGCGIVSHFTNEEEALRKELLSGDLREVRALFSSSGGPCSYPRSSIYILVKKDGSGSVAVGFPMSLSGVSQVQRSETPLDREQLRQLLSRLDSFGLGTLPPMADHPFASLGDRYEYFEARAEGGRRLIFTDTRFLGETGYRKVIRLFHDLRNRPTEPESPVEVSQQGFGSTVSPIFALLAVLTCMVLRRV